MKSVCKLAKNQELLKKSNLIKHDDINAVTKKLPRDMKINFCLNCDEPFKTRIDKNYLFCSGKCTNEYFKKKGGLI